MGKQYYAYLTGCSPALVNGLSKVCCSKDPTAHCFLVDNAKLDALRAEAKAQPGAPERISTNDVLTSRFASIAPARGAERGGWPPHGGVEPSITYLG
jgi:hypothetical protein